MSSVFLEYRLRIRNAADSADALVLSTVVGDTTPYLEGPPQYDGSSFDPLSGRVTQGSSRWRVVDAITSGTSRVLTSQLEDAGFRQQLMRRKAIGEFREDGGSWTALGGYGIVTNLTLQGAAVWDVLVGDPIRTEGAAMAFAPRPDGSSIDQLEPFATYLARWPNRGCLLGGPIRNGFAIGKVQDLGGWTFTVDSQRTAAQTREGAKTFLKFVSGHAPPDFDEKKHASDVADLVNETAGSASVGKPTHFSSLLGATDWRTSFPDYIVEVIQAGVSSYYLVSNRVGFLGGPPQDGNSFPFFETAEGKEGLYVLYSSGLTIGDTVKARAFTMLPSEVCPIYYTGHPVDLWASLMDEAGLAYNATEVTTTKEALGEQLRISLRITEPQPLADFVESVLFGPFGFSVRTNGSGELEPFPTRIFVNTPPSLTIADADVQCNEDGSPRGMTFEIDEGTAIRKVVFEYQRLKPTREGAAGPNGERRAQRRGSASPDGIDVESITVERSNADTGAVGTKEITFSIPGMIHLADSWDYDAAGYVNIMAYQFFDRWGRGIIRAEIPGIRGGQADSVVLGSELLNDLSQLPNANKRLLDDAAIAARAMQVVQITPSPTGQMLTALDSGPNAQPYGTVPTHTIAASSVDGKRVAMLTITNAATLNGDNAAVRVQMATGTTPATTEYVDVAFFPAGTTPTTAFALPMVSTGAVVNARARAEKVGSRPSNWQTPVSVTLTAITDPSGLGATPSGTDGSKCTLAWTVGDSLALTDVYIRLQAESASANVRRTTLPAGSNTYLLEDLTPSTQYTASIQHRDPTTQDLSALVTVNFTAGATTVTLSAPVYPQGFAGRAALGGGGSSREFVGGRMIRNTGITKRDGIYGIAVVASEVPGFVEVQEAVETAVGAGTYGAFATVDKVPSVLANWTIVARVAPNDGLNRQLKARHVRDGATASSYTSTVTVTPWTPQALPPYPTDIILTLTVLAPTSANAGLTVIRFTATATDPAGSTCTVRVESITANASIASGNAVGTFGNSPQTWTVNLPTVKAGVGGVVVEAVAGAKSTKATLPLPEKIQLGGAQGTVAIDSNGSWSFTADHPSALSFKYATSTSAYPSDGTAAAGTLINTAGPISVTAGGTLTFGQTLFVTILPYTEASAGGTSGPSIHLRGSYLTFTATKTAIYSPANWTLIVGDSQIATFTRDATSGWVNNKAQASSQFTRFWLFPDVPSGCTITSVSLEGFHNAASTGIYDTEFVRYASGGKASLGTGGLAAAGTGTDTISLSESTTSRSYGYFVTMQEIQVDNYGKAGPLSITYTMPDPKQSR